MRFASAQAQRDLDDVKNSLATAVVAFDYDGTLAPIVSDPAQAVIHPDARARLLGLGPQVAALAVITGRPVSTVLDLGGLEDVGRHLVEAGSDLLVFGHYGNERWSAREPQIVTPAAPPGLAALRAELPRLLAEAESGAAFVEDKGLAIAIHTRRMVDAQAGFERLRPLISQAATDHGLHLEPGRLVLEVRAPGVDKGGVLTLLIERFDATACLFAGDDLGDLPAFAALARLQDVHTCRVAVASAEQSIVAEHADVIVEDTADLLRMMALLAGDD